jgi:hypothetical protein
MIRIRQDSFARTIIVGFYGLAGKLKGEPSWTGSPLG